VVFTAILLTPRFSGVLEAVKRQNRFSGLPARKKPLKRLKMPGLAEHPAEAGC
jgi:hypothetical protein